MGFDAIKAELESHGTQPGLASAWVAMMPDIKALSEEDRRRITLAKDVLKAFLDGPDDDWVDRWMRGEE